MYSEKIIGATLSVEMNRLQSTMTIKEQMDRLFQQHFTMAQAHISHTTDLGLGYKLQFSTMQSRNQNREQNSTIGSTVDRQGKKTRQGLYLFKSFMRQAANTVVCG